MPYKGKVLDKLSESLQKNMEPLKCNLIYVAFKVWYDCSGVWLLLHRLVDCEVACVLPKEGPEGRHEDASSRISSRIWNGRDRFEVSGQTSVNWVDRSITATCRTLGSRAGTSKTQSWR